MVLGDISTILHGAPAGPGLDTITRTPDALAPDDILEVQAGTVVHGPLSELAAGHGGNLPGSLRSVQAQHRSQSLRGTYTTSIRAHVIDRLAAAVIRSTGTGASPGAVNLSDSAGEGSDNLLGTLNSHGLAGPDGGDSWGRIPSEAGGRRRAASHLRRSRAKTSQCAPCAVRCPTTVASGTVGARSLGAALDIGSIRRARSINGNAAR